MDNNQHLTVSKTFDIIIQQLPNLYCYKKTCVFGDIIAPKKKSTSRKKLSIRLRSLDHKYTTPQFTSHVNSSIKKRFIELKALCLKIY